MPSRSVPLCDPTKTESFIPADRVISALDRYLDKNDYDGALKTLLYWKDEAEKIGDDRGLLTVENEAVRSLPQAFEKGGGLCRLRKGAVPYRQA